MQRALFYLSFYFFFFFFFRHLCVCVCVSFLIRSTVGALMYCEMWCDRILSICVLADPRLSLLFRSLFLSLSGLALSLPDFDSIPLIYVCVLLNLCIFSYVIAISRSPTTLACVHDDMA